MNANSVTAVQEENEFDREFGSREYVCPVCGKTFRIPMYVSLTSYVYVVNVYDSVKKKIPERSAVVTHATERVHRNTVTSILHDFIPYNKRTKEVMLNA